MIISGNLAVIGFVYNKKFEGKIKIRMLTEIQLYQGANCTTTSIMENLGYKEGSTKPRRSMRSINTVAIKSEAEQPLAEVNANNTR